MAVVSEKYDSSNLAVTSHGVVASRRKVLLCQPTVEELAGYRFQGAGQETCNTFCNIPLHVVLCVEMDLGIATNLATSLGMKSCVVK